MCHVSVYRQLGEKSPLGSAHEVIYKQDKAEYGQPVVSSDFTMLKDLDDWLVALNQGVARVPSK